MKSFAAFADVGVATEEIHRAGAEAEQLRHPRVVVVLLRQMAVGAILGRADAAGRVREMRIERLAAVTFGGKCLLLRVNPFAIRVLRTDHDRARRTNHRHAIFLHRAVDAEHENVVAHDLRIVGREIPVGDAFEFILRQRVDSLSSADDNRNNSWPTRCDRSGNPSRIVVREFDCGVRLASSGRNSRPRFFHRAAASSRRPTSDCSAARADQSCRWFAEFPSAHRATWSIAGKAPCLPR